MAKEFLSNLTKFLSNLTKGVNVTVKSAENHKFMWCSTIARLWTID